MSDLVRIEHATQWFTQKEFDSTTSAEQYWKTIFYNPFKQKLPTTIPQWFNELLFREQILKSFDDMECREVASRVGIQPQNLPGGFWGADDVETLFFRQMIVSELESRNVNQLNALQRN